MVETYRLPGYGDSTVSTAVEKAMELAELDPEFRKVADEINARRFDLGEVHITAMMACAIEPGFAMTALGAHNCERMLDDDEKLLFDEVLSTKTGRLVSSWSIPPMALVDRTGTLRMVNHFALSAGDGKFVVASDPFNEKRTVICHSTELPKAGLPGDVNAEDLRREIQIAYYQSVGLDPDLLEGGE